MARPTVDIQIPNIEKDLRDSSKNELQKKTAKASLFTLVIFANELRRVCYLQELVNTILDKFPCRIIFIQGDVQSQESYFHVTVSSVISGQSSNTQDSAVACDQITIKASKDQLFRVPFVVTPHIVPDLPIFLLWGQNPFEEKEIFPHLQPYASRVIFDSECSDNLTNFCKDMQESLDTLKMDIMDISWALVSNWRDLLYQVFDTPDKVKHLDNLKSIIIQYNGSKTDTFKHPEIRAIYLQAWLACCLKWKYRNLEKFETNMVISYIGDANPVIVALSPLTLPDVPPGAINSIEITTTDGYAYTIARKPNLSQAVVHISSNETCELPFTLPLPSIHKGMNFMRETFFSKLGNHYSDMLKIVSKINYEIISSP